MSAALAEKLKERWMHLSPRQRAAAIVTVGLLFAWLFYAGLVQPMAERKNQINAQLARLQQEVAALANVPPTQAGVGATFEPLSADGEASCVAALNELLMSNGLRLKKCSRTATAAETGADEVASRRGEVRLKPPPSLEPVHYRVQATGSFEAVEAALIELKNFPRPVLFGQIRIHPEQTAVREDAPVRLSSGAGHNLELEFDATLYLSKGGAP